MLTKQANDMVILFPRVSEEYPVTIAPINPPADDAVLKATCHLAPMIYSSRNSLPKSFSKAGTAIVPVDS